MLHKLLLYDISTRQKPFYLQDQFVGRNREGGTWEQASQIRDKFEYDRERRMREKGEFTWFYFTCCSCMRMVLHLIYDTHISLKQLWNWLFINSIPMKKLARNSFGSYF